MTYLLSFGYYDRKTKRDGLNPNLNDLTEGGFLTAAAREKKCDKLVNDDARPMRGRASRVTMMTTREKRDRSVIRMEYDLIRFDMHKIPSELFRKIGQTVIATSVP